MVLYLDLLFFQNMVVGYLILYLVKTDLYPGISLRRVIMGALLSSITYIFWYSTGMWADRKIILCAACFFMSNIFVWTFQIHTFSSYLQTLERAIIYLLLMGGAGLLFQEGFQLENSTDSSWYFLFTGFMVAFTIWYTKWKKKIRKGMQFQEKIYDVEFQRHSKTVFRRGLYDSGNLLVSQITGKGICVITFENIKDLLDEREIDFVKEMMNDREFFRKKLMQSISLGFYVIQFSSVGKEHGWMPGILVEHIIVRKEDKILVDTSGMLGISAQKISKDEKYSVLLPADIFISN